MRATFFLITIMLLCSCTTKSSKKIVWVKDGVSDEQADKDKSECKKAVAEILETDESSHVKSSALSRKRVSYFGENENHIDDNLKNRRKIFNLCMELRNYKKEEFLT